MRDHVGLRWLVLAAGIQLHCTTTVGSIAPPDRGLDRADASPGVPPEVAPDAASDAAPETPIDAPIPGNSCEDAQALGERWVVRDNANGEASRCELGGTERTYGWSSIEVPARAVLVLRSWEAFRSPDLVLLFTDCRATTCLPTVRTTSEGFIVRRYFNDSATPRLVRIAARGGTVVFPTIERTAPNLRCDDATLIEREGTYVDDGPFPASDPAPACPEVYEPVGPVRWYRVALPSIEGNTLRVTAPVGVDVRLVTACGASSCAAAPYLQIYNETQRVLRWPVARGATTPLYLAVGRRLSSPPATTPVTFTIGLDSGIHGRLCYDAIRVDGSLDLRGFETRSGAERIPVCNDTAARTVRARWFDVTVPPGHSLIAHTLEVSSAVRTAWQLYADCDDRRCGVAASPASFVTTLEYANTTAAQQWFKLAVGNLAAEYIDALRVRVRVFRPSPNGTCGTARRVAPNELVSREDLTTGREGPPPCAAGLPRRSLWYVTQVPPGHALTPLVVNRSEPEVRVDVPDACPAAACTATFANRTAAPIEVTYAVSQEARLGFFATYDLVARTVPLP